LDEAYYYKTGMHGVNVLASRIVITIYKDLHQCS
jgi:hypothetical protein